MTEERGRTRDQIEAEMSELRGRISDLERRGAAQRDTEQQLRRQCKVLETANRVLREAFSAESEAEIALACLKAAQELTGSRFGFIGELNESGLLDTIAISNPGWVACEIPHSDATKLITNMEIRGLDRSALKEGRSRIVNDPETHPDRVGVPPGHPRITSFLGVLLKRGRKTFGMISLANKKAGYDAADQTDVETLAEVFVPALLRFRAEKHREELLQHVNRLMESRTAELLAANKRLQKRASGQEPGGERPE